jgi:glycosyltransferase involved in cell wall biosynthesis
MSAIGSLFDEMSLLVCRGKPRSGGLPLPSHANVVPLDTPNGKDTRRKFSVMMRLPYYLRTMGRYISRADAVHVPLPGDLPLLGMLVALWKKKPLVARYGGSWVPTARTTLMNRVTRTCMRQFAGGKNVMLATGDGRTPPADGIEWLYVTALSRAELEQIKPDLDRGLANPPRLVYVGRLSVEKGLVNLVKAVAALKQQDVDPLPHVTLIGDGPQKRMLMSLIQESECQAHFEFAGQLDRQQLAERLMEADLCVQPSLTEGFSKAWLDAMAFGLPVVSSRVGAAHAVIGEDAQRGWLVPPGDVQALTDTLRNVLTGPIEWPRMRHGAREYVEQRTLEAWADRIGRLCALRWDLAFEAGKLRN